MRPDRHRLGPLAVSILLGMLVLTGAVAAGVWHYQGGRERDARQEWASERCATWAIRSAPPAPPSWPPRGSSSHPRASIAGRSHASPRSSSRRSSILGLNWTPRVPAAARKSFERDSGLPIVDRGPRETPSRGQPGRVLPAALPGAGYGHERAVLGLDMGIDGGTPAAFAAARDSGQLTMSPAIQLERAPPPRAGRSWCLRCTERALRWGPSPSGGPPCAASRVGPGATMNWWRRS